MNFAVAQQALGDFLRQLLVADETGDARRALHRVQQLAQLGQCLGVRAFADDAANHMDRKRAHQQGHRQHRQEAARKNPVPPANLARHSQSPNSKTIFTRASAWERST
jgi:hypothetical protein